MIHITKQVFFFFKKKECFIAPEVKGCGLEVKHSTAQQLEMMHSHTPSSSHFSCVSTLEVQRHRLGVSVTEVHQRRRRRVIMCLMGGPSRAEGTNGSPSSSHHPLHVFEKSSRPGFDDRDIQTLCLCVRACVS